MLLIERESSPARYSSVTVRVEIPEGTMYVILMEDTKGKLIGIQLSIGKAGSAISAWSHAMARICTLALDKGATIFDLIEQLSANVTDRAKWTKDNVKISSGPDGLSYALLKYHKTKTNGGYELSEERPPRLGVRRTSR